MARIFRVSGFMIDRNSILEEKDIRNAMKNELYSMRHVHVEQSDMPAADLTVLADPNCDLAECNKYFDNTGFTIMGERVVKAGEVYHHFKGKDVTVLAISQDSEVPGKFYVVYKCEIGVFNRPYEMFVSEVDHSKYPEVTQKWRFEKIKDAPAD